MATKVFCDLCGDEIPQDDTHYRIEITIPKAARFPSAGRSAPRTDKADACGSCARDAVALKPRRAEATR